jgi:hypothetical protein
MQPSSSEDTISQALQDLKFNLELQRSHNIRIEKLDDMHVPARLLTPTDIVRHSFLRHSFRLTRCCCAVQFRIVSTAGYEGLEYAGQFDDNVVSELHDDGFLFRVGTRLVANPAITGGST